MKSISDVDTFELLPQFFCHNKAEVRMAALEVNQLILIGAAIFKLQKCPHTCTIVINTF